MICPSLSDIEIAPFDTNCTYMALYNDVMACHTNLFFYKKL